jgi:ABC-type branched-subunit amino acid transport system permease subunit
MGRLRLLRLVCAVAGFALAVAGVVLEDRRIVWAAIATLALAFLLRIYLRRRERDTDDTTPLD